MGYYTTYELDQVKNPVDSEALEDYIREHEEELYALEPDGSSAESTKWYEHDEDMFKLSAEFPNTVFKLHGVGEEQGDEWEKYYHNGKLIHTFKVILTILKPDLSNIPVYKKGK